MEIFELLFHRYRWIIGLFVSLGGGLLVPKCFIQKLEKRLVKELTKLSAQEEEGTKGVKGAPRPFARLLEEVSTWRARHTGIPSCLTGLIEQLFFTVAVACEVSGAAIAMIGWATVKMYTGWNYPHYPSEKTPPRLLALSSLLGNLVALLLALIGGLICGGQIWKQFDKG